MHGYKNATYTILGLTPLKERRIILGMILILVIIGIKWVVTVSTDGVYKDLLVIILIEFQRFLALAKPLFLQMALRIMVIQPILI